MKTEISYAEELFYRFYAEVIKSNSRYTYTDCITIYELYCDKLADKEMACLKEYKIVNAVRKLILPISPPNYSPYVYKYNE